MEQRYRPGRVLAEQHAAQPEHLAIVPQLGQPLGASAFRDELEVGRVHVLRHTIEGLCSADVVMMPMRSHDGRHAVWRHAAHRRSQRCGVFRLPRIDERGPLRSFTT
jgi:hypothetical protein